MVKSTVGMPACLPASDLAHPRTADLYDQAPHGRVLLPGPSSRRIAAPIIVFVLVLRERSCWEDQLSEPQQDSQQPAGGTRTLRVG